MKRGAFKEPFDKGHMKRFGFKALEMKILFPPCISRPEVLFSLLHILLSPSSIGFSIRLDFGSLAFLSGKQTFIEEKAIIQFSRPSLSNLSVQTNNSAFIWFPFVLRLSNSTLFISCFAPGDESSTADIKTLQFAASHCLTWRGKTWHLRKHEVKCEKCGWGQD